MKKEMKSLSSAMMAKIFYFGIFVLLVVGGITGYQFYKANEKQAQLKVLAIDAAKKYVEGNGIVVTKPMSTSLTYLKEKGYLGEFDDACIQNSYVAINSNSNYDPTITCSNKKSNSVETYGIYEGILTYGISVTPDYSNQEVMVTITPSEPVNVVEGWTLSNDGISLTKTYTENTDIILTLVAAQNPKKTVDVAFRVNNIDRVAPILTVSYSDTTPTNQDVIVTIRGNEKLRAMEGWTLSSDSYSISKAYSNNTNETVSAMDLAGNKTEAGIIIQNIDKDAPVLTITRTPDEKTKEDVIVVITANEALQPLEGWTLSSDKRSLSKIYHDNKTETVVVRDIARNEVNQEIKVDNIDRIAPTLTAHYSNKEITKEPVIVTITSNEALQEKVGWTLSNDRLSMTKTYTSNVKETVLVTDIVGNIGSLEIEIQNIDTTAPVVTASYDVTKPTNGKVVATITANEALQKVEGWTLSNDQLSMSKIYIENANEDITVMDIAGNTSVVNISITNIDKEPPVVKIIYTPKEPTNGNVTATVVSNKPLREVEGWTLSSDKLSMSKTYTGNMTESVTIIDEAGNKVNKHVYVANIDREEPKVNISYSNKEQTKDDVTITITSNKALREIEGWTLSSDKLTLTKVVSDNEEGTVSVTDLAGNITKVNYKVANIDHVGPSTTVEYDKTTATNGNVTVTIRASEKILEVEGWTLSKDQLSISKTYTDNVDETIIVSDLVGNTSAAKVEIKNIDKEAPTIKIYYSPSVLTKEDVVVTVVSNEALQKVEGWTLSSDKRSMTKTYTENKKETIGFIDLAGNRRNKSVNVTNIDKESPRLQLTYSTKDMTKEDVVVTVVSNEILQPVEGWTLSSDQLSMSKTYTKNIKEEVTFLDVVGNASVATVEIKNIDKKAPTLTVTYSETEATNGNVTVTITSNEKILEIEGWTRSEDKLSISKTYEENMKEIVTVSDLVGNTSDATVEIQNIDKKAPTLTVTYSETEATRGNVTVTITSNEKILKVEGWTRSEDQLSISKIYEENIKETVTVSDLVGNTSDATVEIQNIDKKAPTLTVTYSETEATRGNVTVTITSNEKILKVEGWTRSEDKLSISKTYEENIKETVTVSDLVGNTSDATIEIKNIDKKAPTLTVTYSETKATNGNVTVTITSNEKILEVEGWTRSEDQLSISKTYEENIEEIVTVSDLVGNPSDATIEIKNIDKKAPTLTVTYSETKATNGNVTVTITSNEKILEVEGWTRSEDQLSISKTYEENIKETVTVSDLVGNTSDATVEIQNIDKTKAVVTVSYNPEGKTNGNVTVTLTSDKQLQNLDGWVRSSDKKTMVKTYTENEKETIVVKDHVGNETTVQVNVTQIDRVAPTLNVTYSTTEQTKDSVIVTVTSNEELQEKEGWTLSKDGMSMSKEYHDNISEEVTFMDIAGNTSKATITLNNIDKVAPIVTVSYNPKTWTNQDVTVTIRANEKMSAKEGWTLSKDGMSMSKVYHENKKETVTVSDLVGNSVDADISIHYIDRVAPTLTVTYSPEENTQGDVTVTITSNKKLREKEGWILSSDKRSMSKVYHENKEETVTVKDIAGNTSDAVVKVSNIDRTAPVVHVTYSTEAATNGSVIVTITSNEALQEKEGWTLSKDKMSMSKEYTQNTDEIVIVKDLAGNNKEAQVTIQNIDRIAPTLTVSYDPTKATKGDVTATIWANEALQPVEGWTLSKDKMSLSKVYRNNVSETIEVKDLAGNSKEAMIKIKNIDKEAPIVKVHYSTTEGTKNPVTVTLTANEAIREIEGWTRSEDKLSISKVYRENIEEVVTVTDAVGNTTDITVNVRNIDHTAPKLEVSYDPVTPTNKTVTATIRANEALQEKEGWILSSDKLSMTKKFTSNIEEEVTILDLAGNASEVTVSIQNIDKTGPKTNVTYSTTELTNKGVTVTITADEPLQKLPGWTLSEDQLSISKVYESNMTEQVLVKDLAGNITTTEVSIQNIDKTAPTVSTSYSSKEWTKENVTVTLTSNKKMQELDGWDLDETGFIMTKIYKNNQKETITVLDLAGNTVNVTIKINNIDKEAPILKVVDGINAYTADFTKEIHVSKTETFKNLEAVATDNIDTNVKIHVTGDVDSTKLGSYPVTYEAVDHVGNKTTVVATIKVIDTETPVITLNGEASVTIGLGSKYIDAGAKVTDNYDTNVNLVTTDNIDIFQVGTYYVTYKATDSSNNKTVVTRTVIVEPGHANDLVRNVNHCETTGDCYNKENEDNYVWYSGYLWRIIKVNSDNTVKMVTEDSIAGFSYDNDSSLFKGSIAEDWLLNEFYPSLNNASSLVVTSDYCNEALLNTTEVRYSCNAASMVRSKVGLLTIDEYNILGAESSYLNTGDHFFTMTPSLEGYMWVVQYDGTKKYTFHVNNPYAMRPVITLATTAKIRTGRGTKNNPYRLEGDYSATSNTALNTRKTGEYVTFANQNWRIVSTGSVTKLVLDSNYTENGTSAKIVFGNSAVFNLTSGIGKYLNTNVYNNLFNDREKQLLAPMNYYYNSYRLGDNPRTTSLTNTGTMVNAYVGLNNVGELMSGSSNTSRTPNFTSWLLNYNSVNNNGWFTSDGGTSEYSLLSNVRGIRPTIALKSTVRIIDGNGTSTNPYVLAYQ